MEKTPNLDLDLIEGDDSPDMRLFNPNFNKIDEELTNTYRPPEDGIPATDMNPSVRSSLTKAESSVQTVNGAAPAPNGNITVAAGVQSVNGRAGNVTGLAEQTSVNNALTSKADLVDGYVVDEQLAPEIVRLVDGLLPPSTLPSLAITRPYPVTSEAEMLALDVEIGSIAVRSDESKTYILGAANASILENWVELEAPASGVTSVNSRSGTVTGLAEASDVNAALVPKADLVSGRVPIGQMPTALTNAVIPIVASNDTTGATDLAAINAALVAVSTGGGGSVVLRGVYFINGAIQMPDNTTLVLFNADVTLTAGANSNVVRNKDQTTTGNKNIGIVGIGRSRLIGQLGAKLTAAASIGSTSLSLDTNLPSGTYQIEGGGGNAESRVIVNGNSTSVSAAPYIATLSTATTKGHAIGKGIANQTRQSSLRDNVGIFMVMVDGLRIHNVEIGPTNAFTGCLQGVKNARITQVHYAQDVITINQDGIDIGPGCSNIVIDGVTGKTGDDFCSIYAQNTSGSLHPLFAGNVTANNNDITNVTVRNVTVDVGINVFRLQAGDSFKLKGVFAQNIVNTHTGATTSGSPQCVVQTGTTEYVNTAPTSADAIDHVVIDGYVGKFDYVLSCDSVIAHAQFSNIHHNSTAWTRIFGFQNIVTSWTPLASHVVFENVTTSNTTGGGVIMGFVRGTFDNITFRNVEVERATAVLVNDGTVTNLSLSDIHCRVMAGIPFRSTIAETGYADNVHVDIYSGGVNDRYTTAACKLRLGKNMPFFGSGDLTPVATAGSEIICRAGKDPTGGSFAQGAQYIADGTAWNRGVTLVNLV